MGNGHPEADAGGEDRLPLLDRAEHLLEVAAGAGHQVTRPAPRWQLVCRGLPTAPPAGPVSAARSAARRGLGEHGTNVTAAQRGGNAKSRLAVSRPPRPFRTGGSGLSSPVGTASAAALEPTGRPRDRTAPSPETPLDLSPDRARTALEAWAAERGLPRYRADQMLRRLWTAPVRSWEDATELPAALRARAGAEPSPAPARGRRGPAVGGRHPQVPLAPRRRRGDRVGAHPQRRPPHALHLVPGGLRPPLRLLRHRPHGLSCGTSRRSRSRAGAGDPAARRRRTGPPTSSSWGWASRCSTGRRWIPRSAS